MALAGGKLFVRTEHGISCYDLLSRGPYIDRTIVTKNTVTFVFEQTGGGLVVKDAAAGLKDVVIADAAGPATPATPAKPATPAEATLAGDTIVVDIRGCPRAVRDFLRSDEFARGEERPACACLRLERRARAETPHVFRQHHRARQWSSPAQNGTWNAAATYRIAGTVTRARVDPWGKTVTLTTDKTWKAGDAVTLTYPRFHVDRGDASRETLTLTARERSAARFLKTDETTSGSWKGIYGAQGAHIVGDTAATVKCAVVTPSKNESKILGRVDQ